MLPPPVRHEAVIYQRTDFTASWQFTDPFGNPQDFTGAAAAFALRVLPTDTTPQQSVTTTPSANGQIQFAAPGNGLAPGTIQLTLAALGNLAMTATAARGDLVVTWPSGAVQEFVHIDARIVAGSTY